MVAGLDAKQAGAFLRQSWFIQQPTLVGGMVKTAQKPPVDVDEEDNNDDDSSSGSGSEDEDDLDDLDDRLVTPKTKRKRSLSDEPPAKTVKDKSKGSRRVSIDPDLLTLVPRCGTVSKMETARVIFEEETVRRLADADPIPDDSAIAGREFRYESRVNEALGRLLDLIGREMIPSKPPKDMKALQRTAEDIFSAVSAVVRGGGSGRAGAKWA